MTEWTAVVSRTTSLVSAMAGGLAAVQDGEPGIEVVLNASLHEARLQRGVKYHST